MSENALRAFEGQDCAYKPPVFSPPIGPVAERYRGELIRDLTAAANLIDEMMNVVSLGPWDDVSFEALSGYVVGNLRHAGHTLERFRSSRGMGGEA